MNLDSLVQQAEETAVLCQKRIDETVRFNLHKVLSVFQKNRVGEIHLGSTSGYGYNDLGRTVLEKIYAEVFGAEDALVRQQIISGTHAITLALFGNLLPGDELLAVGKPYDTLQKVIGTDKKEPGTLREMGVLYREIPLVNGAVDPKEIAAAIRPETKIVSIQRSKGYAWRPSVSVNKIGEIAQAIKKKYAQVVVFVDNCYGEFVEEKEPLEVGADLIAGSMIKNPGGGIAPGGGYIAGRRELVERAAFRLTAPGIGKEIGPSLENNRLFLQGLFLAPHVVGEALWGAVFTAALFAGMGFDVQPEPESYRSDIVQAIKLEERERVLEFCRGIQHYSPVDSYVRPEPWDMPGYDHQVIMAAGAFVQGSSIELSADAPMREPYIVYFQGGTSRHHVLLAVTETVKRMTVAGLL
ncbi:MAG: aminotransferase class I/II-fold pyridoxal phosphate-dependent enzyme [Bacillota bacterium]|jgi:cystathionine beta-lyase family protein involved in aluminum resistance